MKEYGNRITVRIDEDLKNQATTLFESLGMDLSTAIRIFLIKSVTTNSIPFDLKKEEGKIKVKGMPKR